MTRASLITDIRSSLVPKWAFFWGHTPTKDGSITKSCFSQWWDEHPFELESIRYATAEHFMMAEKARLFGDEQTLSEIQITRDWNVPASGSGFVTRFEVEADYLSRFTEQVVGGAMHRELWVLAEKLEEFNQHIIGLIKVTQEFR